MRPSSLSKSRGSQSEMKMGSSSVVPSVVPGACGSERVVRNTFELRLRIERCSLNSLSPTYKSHLPVSTVDISHTGPGHGDRKRTHSTTLPSSM